SALCLALLALAGEEPDRLELVRLGARVENEWVGAQTGLLDHLAAQFGHEGSALRIDIAALELEEVPLDLGDWTLAVLDSNSPHDNAASGYNRRREECARAAELLGIDSLRRATLEDVPRLPDPLDRRVRHVIEENERVDRTVMALAHGDLREVGALLDASHGSLRDLYEVSTPELEQTVTTMKEAGAAGARVMGGGFGGSVLALFPPAADPPTGSLRVEPGPAARLL